MTMRRRMLGGLLGAAALVAPGVAAADMGPKWDRAVFLPVGLNLGGAIHPSKSLPTGFVLGGEASVVYIDRNLLWAGGYVDALHDFGKGATRFSTGPEIGFAFFGLDGGYLAELRSGVFRHGVTLRAVLSLSFVSVYGRWGYLPGAPIEPHFGEIGALLKFPIPLFEKQQDRWRGRPPEPPPPRPPPPSPPVSPERPTEFATPPPGKEPEKPLEVPAGPP